MRILHVLPALGPGGMEKLVLQLTADAVANGDTVLVAAAHGSWSAEVTRAGGTHIVLPATSRRTSVASVAATAVAVTRLARCIRRVRPDVLHSHNVRAAVIARLAIAMSRRRVVLMPTLHGVAPGDYAAASRILRRTARRVIACAPAVAHALRESGYPAGRIDVITNGAALLPAGQQRQAELRVSLGLGSAPLVLGIGRLAEQKDWPTFIAAASLLPGPQYAVAGDGPLRHDLSGLARRSGDQVLLLGVVDDVAALLGLASCVVSTSRWEGMPLTILEALSLGAPVVATEVSGLAELVPATAALLVPQGDEVAVSEAVRRILSDRDLVARLRKSALSAAPGWAPQRMLQLYRAAYLAAWTGQAHWA
jgi:glycosyltransferase involved in cell wall biosynthesis